MPESTNNWEEMINSIPNIYVEGPKDVIQQRNVAHLKRAVECYLYDPVFLSAFTADPAHTLHEYGIDADPTAAQVLLVADVAARYTANPASLPVAVQQYHAFFAEKLRWRSISQEVNSVPTHPAFKKWRQRQVNRCWGAFSGANTSFVHVPLVFELSLGCSVGCPFCALSSQPLQSIFRATEENMQLWQSILQISQSIIGPAAAEAVCYCASEPLDNPDYELFEKAYREILGKTPQITTAVAMRDPVRTKNLLQNSLSGKPIIHRFSVLDLATFRQICQHFTPEELLYVELLARYEESMTNTITKAGRSLHVDDSTADEDPGKTISCASGFIVNMAEQSVRLSTPCDADAEHPTGEIIIGRFHFKDAPDFEQLLLKLIAEHMPLSLDMQQPLWLQSFYRYEETTDSLSTLYGASKFVFKLKEEQPPYFYQAVIRLLLTGTYSGREIAMQVNEETNVEPALIFNFLRYLDKAGALYY